VPLTACAETVAAIYAINVVDEVSGAQPTGRARRQAAKLAAGSRKPER
jgi:hypothetical protein